MQRLGPAIDAAFGRPRAIVTVSAHTAARVPVVLAAPRHEAIYDFGGFDPKLRTLRYDAAGDPALAARMLQLLQSAGIDAQTRRPGRPRPRRVDRASLHLSRGRHPGRSARLRPRRFAGGAVQARRGAAAADRRRRARRRQRQHHPQPAPPVRRTGSGRAPTSPKPPTTRRSATGSPSARRRATGTRCSPIAARRRTRSRCTRPTSTCCRGTSPPAPAAATRCRCASTTARRWAASAWTPMRSAPRAGDARRGPGATRAAAGLRRRALSAPSARCRRRRRRTSPST